MLQPSSLHVEYIYIYIYAERIRAFIELSISRYAKKSMWLLIDFDDIEIYCKEYYFE